MEQCILKNAPFIIIEVLEGWKLKDDIIIKRSRLFRVINFVLAATTRPTSLLLIHPTIEKLIHKTLQNNHEIFSAVALVSAQHSRNRIRVRIQSPESHTHIESHFQNNPTIRKTRSNNIIESDSACKCRPIK